MSEIKPVYQTTIKNDGYFSVINLTSTDENERDKWKAAGYDVKTLYPAAAYEALKAENEELKNTVTKLNGWIKVWEHSKRNEAQAKRIAELEEKDEMLGDMLDLLKIDKENWFRLYSVVAELKSKNGDSK